MSAIKGLDVLIKVGSTVVGGQRNASLEMSAETIDTTVKSTGGWYAFDKKDTSYPVRVILAF